MSIKTDKPNVEVEVIAAAAGTFGPFSLSGGMYQVAANGTWGGGSAILNQLGPDGYTYLSVSASITADGGQTLFLPPGIYEVVTVTATGVIVDIAKIRSPGVV